MGPLLHSCVEMREPIELSFGVVSRVGLGPGIGVRNRGPRGSRGKGWILGLFAPLTQLFQSPIFERNLFDLCVKS